MYPGGFLLILLCLAVFMTVFGCFSSLRLTFLESPFFAIYSSALMADSDSNRQNLRSEIRDEKPERVLSRMTICFDSSLQVEFNRVSDAPNDAKRHCDIVMDSNPIRRSVVFRIEEKTAMTLVLESSSNLEVHLEQWKSQGRLTDRASAFHYFDRTFEQHGEVTFVFLLNAKTIPKRYGMKDVENFLLEALLRNFKCWRYSSSSELPAMIRSTAWALATQSDVERKRKCGFDWHAENFKANVVHVNENGLGLKNLWPVILMQVPGCTYEIAKTVADEYPSMRLLFQAYDNCEETQRRMLLANLVFRTGPESQARGRRVGPVLSERIYNVFNEKDPDVLL
ncbi:unnamed protein product [Notodromas monacha]|uniref:Crossover junction endonuclease EME1 n=1 Tax=Notodromas monacha TaxID=399045 RepID=A0A7R9C1M7_9CRUS|nr:unnamed protein product [Notodromas monacha]CAG0925269.1 unnamed protein product [Notodromas monacha]